MTEPALRIAAHRAALAALRFCPMMTPAAEVASVTFREAHATRSRAVALWRIAAGVAPWTARDAALLYESTLDSISEAFDVYHAPISLMMLDARADAFDAGLAPDCVIAALNGEPDIVEAPPSTARRIFLASEAARAGDGMVEAGAASLARVGIDAAT